MVKKIEKLLATDYSQEQILDLWGEIMGHYDNLYAAAVSSHGPQKAWFVVENENSSFIALMDEVQERIEWQYPDLIS